MTPMIRTFFHEDSSTFSHVVSDCASGKAAVIDPVLDYDLYSGRSSTHFADEIMCYIRGQSLSLAWILETHIHADHISAAHYLRQNFGGKIGIGAKITHVLDFWVPLFDTQGDTPLDASAFDCLFQDGQVVELGNTQIKVIHTPGHTPACVSYLMQDAIFVGDAIFMPDIGTGRTDFPGGSAEVLYDSIQKIFDFPEDTKLFMCHDYPPHGVTPRHVTSIKAQKETNVMIRVGTSKEDYVALRQKRDEGKAVPKLLLPALQVNLRAGSFGAQRKNGLQYINIPINAF